MRNKRWFPVLLAGVLLLTVTACGKKNEPVTPAPVVEEESVVSSLAEAEEAIAAGKYEAAYRYLLTDTSEEAVALRSKLVYVPVSVTQERDGVVCVFGHWQYDAAGNPTCQDVSTDFAAEGDASNTETTIQCTYDAAHRLLTKTTTRVKDGESSTATETNTYDAAGNRLTQETVHSGGSWTKTVYTYDAAGNWLTCDVTSYDGTWKKSVAEYDSRGNMLYQECRRSYEAWDREEYTYDESDNLLTHYVVDAYGTWSKTVYTYDAAGNKLTKEYTDSDNDVEKETYASAKDAQGNPCLTYAYSLTHVNDGWREKETTYDVAGNELTKREYLFHGLQAEQNSGSYVVCTYDDKGNCLTRSEYTYLDHDDWEGSVTFESSYAFTYTYDGDGRILTCREVRSGLTGETGHVEHTYSYNADGSYSLSKRYYEDDLLVSSVDVDYDTKDRVLRRETRNESGSWTRDTFVYRERGLSVQRLHFEEYDDLKGNYATCTFDEDGNCLTEEERKDGVVTKTVYTYDSEGNCLTEETTDGDQAVTKREFTYDAYGNRLSEKVTNPSGSWSQQTIDFADNLLCSESVSGSKSYKTTIEWELRYFPDGVPGQFVLDECGRAAKAVAQNFFDYTW